MKQTIDFNMGNFVFIDSNKTECTLSPNEASKLYYNKAIFWTKAAKGELNKNN